MLDTHVAIRWLFEGKKLSREQFRALENAVRRNEPVGISAVSLVEAAAIVSDGRLKLKTGLSELFAEMEADPAFHIFPLTCEIAAEVALMGALRDPADRAIVATARIHRLTLVTSDQRIIESRLTAVID